MFEDDLFPLLIRTEPLLAAGFAYVSDKLFLRNGKLLSK